MLLQEYLITCPRLYYLVVLIFDILVELYCKPVIRSHNMKYYLILFFISILFLSNSSYSQENFEPIPKDKQDLYHIDFARYFFSSPEREQSDRSILENKISELESLGGKISRSPEILLQALRINDNISVLLAMHDAYLYLRYAVNTKDEKSYEDDNALISEVNSRTQFLSRELMQISDDTLGMFITENPELEPYKFEIGSSRRFRLYTLPQSEEITVGSLSPVINGWQSDLYENLIARTQFETIETKDGKLNVWKQRSLITDNPDRSVREEGFKKRYEGFESQRDLYAFALIHLIKANNSLSQIHNYKNFEEESFYALFLNQSDVANMLEKISQNAGIYKNYQQIRADHIQKSEGYSDMNPWDMITFSGKSALPRFTIEQASSIILKALEPLGEEYGNEFAQLLDPANRRMDIVKGENRLNAGGGVGFPYIPNVFYSNGYEGYFGDVSVLAHEGGHVVHFQLMGNNKIKPVYGSGPNYFSESFAILNELLLADYLYNHEKDLDKKIFFLERFLEIKGLEIFKGAHDAALERAIYNAVDSDKIQSADDLDSLTINIDSKYSIWTYKHTELKDQWMTNRLMFEDPLYLSNYMYGGLLALKYFEMLKKDPAGFQKNYIALMRNGFDDSPTALLKKFLNIDLESPDLLTDVLKIIENKVNDLKELYIREEKVKK